jgi:RNA polymerase sigma factor (sigma-70 family)
MRDLSWSELLDLLASPAADENVVDAGWAELRRRVSIFLAIIRRGRPAIREEDAEDLVQQLLLRIREPRVFHAIRSAKAPHAYVMTIARNIAIDHVRRTSHEVPLERDTRSTEPPSSFQAEVRALLGTLTKDEQLMLRLRFWEEMEIAEIARIVGLPYSTVAKRLFRIVARLRNRMQTPPGGVN